MFDKPTYKPHEDSEGVDRIEIDTVPRFKTSGMSGDGWRVSTRIRFYRKGVQVFERGFNRLRDAVAFLPWVLHVEAIENSEVPALFGAKPEECFQPGCSEPSVNEYRLKQEWSPQGEGPLPKKGWEVRRAFCMKHSHRGDAAFEDSDENYELVKGPGHKTLAPKDISPSVFGGMIDMSGDIK